MALSSAETRLSNANASYNSASTNANITNSITNPDNIAAAKATVDSLFDGSISEKINLSDQSQWVKIK